jgi:membrane fusion protein (multidrug efflux system)
MSFAKQIVVIAALALVAAGGYLGWQEFAGAQGSDSGQAGPRRGGGGPMVETAKAERRALERVVDAVDTTRARRAVEVTPLASGIVTGIGFHAGKEVGQGDILLRLDSDIEQADLIEADARLKEAVAALQRARSLQKTSAVSAAAVDKLVATLATAQAERDRAARRLRDRTVTAPFAGIVGFAQVELGARVTTNDTVTTLDDLSLVEIEFALPEGLYGRIEPGQRIVADATAFAGRSFDGVIETIDSRIDPVSRAFKARAVVANPDNALPAGMFMHIAVVLDAREALTVPEEAIVVDGSRTYLFVVKPRDGGQGLVAEQRDVALGQRAFGHVEIADGLSAGEEVVTLGVQKARNGAPVRKAGGGPGGRGGPGGKGGKGGGRPQPGAQG